jgi:Leu/Phe-tRNA-protein transferase
MYLLTLSAMTGKDLKKWMEKNEKTVIDVASATKTHPQTVQRFLNGKTVHRATHEAFKRVVVDTASANSDQKHAIG